MAEGMLEPANGRVTLSAVVVGVLRPKGRFRIGSLLQIRHIVFGRGYSSDQAKGEICRNSFVDQGGKCFVWKDNSTVQVMCGILVSVAIKGSEKSALNGLTPWIAARGPDSLQTRRIQIPFPDTQQSVELTFTSSVLHLRGHDVTVQPLVSQSGDILCWNGEIWQGLSVADDENDGLKLLDELVSGKKVWEVMGQIEGPWAMVFYDASKRRLWYGRDCLGRRSLMRKMIPETGELLLSSVGVDMDGWDEVGVEGLGCLELQEFINSCNEVPILLQGV